MLFVRFVRRASILWPFSASCRRQVERSQTPGFHGQMVIAPSIFNVGCPMIHQNACFNVLHMYDT
jgi:hypothetical protein